MALGAYQSEAARGNVLNALAHPAVVSPLAAIGGAAQTYGAVMDARKLQAQQAIGGILQQATDAQGNVDYGKANALAAQAGPAVQMGMQTMLQSNSQLLGQQQQNAMRHMSMVGGAALSLVNDPSDGNLDKVRTSLINSGVPQAVVDQEIGTMRTMSPDDRRQYAYQHGVAAMDPNTAMARVGGQTTTVDTGGAVQPYTLYQPRPGQPGFGVSGGGAVPTTMHPDVVGTQIIEWPATEDDVKAGRASSLGQPVRMGGADLQRNLGQGGLLPPGAHVVTAPPVGGPGVVNSDGSPASPKNPPRLLNVPGQGGGGSSSGAGGKGPAPVPPAPRADLGGGTPIASASPYAPATGPASPPSPAVQGDVGAIVAGMNQARGQPVAGTQTASTFAVGPGVQEPAEWKASADRLAQDDTTAANFAQTQFPVVQALKEYGRGTVTGPNADFFNRIGGYIRTPLEKMGVNVGDLGDNTARYDALNKWLSQIVANTPFAAGSDARLAQVLNGSATTHINQAAGEDMLKAGIVLQRMNVAANQEWHNLSQQDQAKYGGLYLNFLRGYANRVDPRAFGVDMYNPQQLESLRTALKSGGEAAAKRFNDSKAIADGLSAQPALP